jgi:multicomponent Na+:H+ antiporter subunit G
MIESIGMFFIITGVIFDFLGVLGLIRFPDVYNRLQAATKCVTFGSIGILFGVLLIQGFSTFGFKAFIGILFICIASPTAAHAIARAAHRSRIPLAKETMVDRYEEDKELIKSEVTEEKETV